jgi:fumarate reductase flavoprotein subunit
MLDRREITDMLLPWFDEADVTRALAAVCVVVTLGLCFVGGTAAQEVKGAHGRIGLTCANCHGDEATPSRPAMSACLGCHVSYDALAAKTARLQPNPHKSHLGELRCTYCHSGHGTPKLYCNECHDFKHVTVK